VTNTAIGAALAISGKTVEKHIRAIYDKLGVSARVAAAHWWWSAGGRDGAA
jgi:DNA-binding NarL/FixJ family response regulator